MISKKTTIAAAAIGLCGFVLSANVLAEETFYLGSAGGVSGHGNVWTDWSASGDYYVTARAFSDTWDNPNPDRFQTAELTSYGSSGWGVVNQNAGDTSSNGGQHGVDNKTNGGGSSGSVNDGDRDLILFDIRNSGGDLVEATLSSLRIGYRNGDSDMDVMAFTDPLAAGAVNPASIDGNTLPNLLAADGGWERFSINNVPVNVKTNTTAGTTTSSHWVVATRLTQHNDAVKLNKLYFHVPTTPPNGVPVPASIMLVALGIPLVRWFRRTGLARVAV
jgi:hypothetical protein